jgi:hypothetical protein
MSSQSSKPSRLRFLLVATYAWLVVAFVGVITIFGIYSTMTPREFQEYAKENCGELLLVGAMITFGGVALSFMVRELRNSLRRKPF